MAKGHFHPVERVPFNGSFSTDWVTSKIDKNSIDYAENLGKYLADNKFTTSQFRNFYGELKRIQLNGIEQAENQTAFLLLRPKLAYSAKRAGGVGAAEFRKQIELAMETVKIGQEDFVGRFKNFCDLVEAILAFHKAAGGND